MCDADALKFFFFFFLEKIKRDAPFCELRHLTVIQSFDHYSNQAANKKSYSRHIWKKKKLRLN